MIGIWQAHAQTWLLAVFALTMIGFALPIFLMPLRWAKVLGWKIPADTDLALYFGRCLGAFVLVVEALMLRAGLTGEGLLFTYQAVAAAAGMMVAVHTWGALERVQPLIETLEIGMYAGLLGLTLLFWPVAGP